jgi:hypothetical protein
MSQRLYGDGGGEPRILDVIGPWAAVAMAVFSLTVLYTDLSRFAGPIGEAYLASGVLQPGGADFAYPYSGARALVMHVNPYHNDVPELRDPYGRDMSGLGYPPSHFLLYLPIALVAKSDRLMASRIWFHCNLAWLVVLSFLSWRLLRRLVPAVADSLWLLLPFLLFVFALGSGTLLLLERGQSDLFTSLLCWSAVLASSRRRWFLATFLATWATLIKGYPVLFLPGFGLLGLTRSHWKGTVLGGCTAALIFLAPLARYVPGALAMVSNRSAMFWPVWYNHSFKNLAYALSPAWAPSGHKLFTGLALVATVSCWIRARRAQDATDRLAWLTLYTTCSLATILGYSSLSCPYNTIIVLPGAVFLALNQRRFVALAGIPQRFEWVLGPMIAFVGFLLFIEKLGSDTFPGGAVGLLGIVTISGFLAIAQLGVAFSQARAAVSIPASGST